MNGDLLSSYPDYASPFDSGGSAATLVHVEAWFIVTRLHKLEEMDLRLYVEDS